MFLLNFWRKWHANLFINTLCNNLLITIGFIFITYSKTRTLFLKYVQLLRGSKSQYVKKYILPATNVSLKLMLSGIGNCWQRSTRNKVKACVHLNRICAGAWGQDPAPSYSPGKVDFFFGIDLCSILDLWILTENNPSLPRSCIYAGCGCFFSINFQIFDMKYIVLAFKEISIKKASTTPGSKSGEHLWLHIGKICQYCWIGKSR